MTLEQAIKFQKELKYLLYLNTVYRNSLTDAFNSGVIKEFGEIVANFYSRALKDKDEIIGFLTWVDENIAKCLESISLKEQ